MRGLLICLLLSATALAQQPPPAEEVRAEMLEALAWHAQLPAHLPRLPEEASPEAHPAHEAAARPRAREALRHQALEHGTALAEQAREGASEVARAAQAGASEAQAAAARVQVEAVRTRLTPPPGTPAPSLPEQPGTSPPLPGPPEAPAGPPLR